MCWDMLSIWEVSLPGKAIHENATPARELWYWYWFDRLQECLSNSHLQVSYRTTTCRQCNRASPIDIGTLQKENPKTNVAPNNHGKIVNIMFFPFNGLILWRYYCWWYTNLDLVGTNRRFFRTTITCPRWFPVVPRDSRNFSRDMRASTSGLGADCLSERWHWNILLMDEILHHLGWLKPLKIMG